MGGCCSSKVAASGGGTIIGAAAGTIVAGPIGLGIGAIIGLAAAGTIGKAVEAPTSGLLRELWRSLIVRDEIIDTLPTIGLLRLDRRGGLVPPALDTSLMAKEVNSTLFRVEPVTVPGIDLATVRAGAALSTAQHAALRAAIAHLTARRVLAITADSGLFVHCQREAARHTGAPVLLSPLLQLPLLLAILAPTDVILVLTHDARTFSQRGFSIDQSTRRPRR